MRSAECGVCMGGRLLLDAPPNTPHSAFRTPHWGRGGDRSLGEAGVCDGGRPGDRAGGGAAAGARRRGRRRRVPPPPGGRGSNEPGGRGGKGAGGGGRRPGRPRGPDCISLLRPRAPRHGRDPERQRGNGAVWLRHGVGSGEWYATVRTGDAVLTVRYHSPLPTQFVG